MMENKQDVKIKKMPHHEPKGPCLTRPPYRQGKKLTAVKVYTVNDESQHLILRGVPKLNLYNELKHLCLRYGNVKLLHAIPEYASDEELFTEVYHVQFTKIQSARFAKHMLDNKCYFGGILKACYAPELESLAETRFKLQNRRREIAIRVNKMQSDDIAKSESTNLATVPNMETSHIEPSSSLLQASKDSYDALKSDSWISGGLKNISLVPTSRRFTDETVTSTNIVDVSDTTAENTIDSTMASKKSTSGLFPRSLIFPVKRSKQKSKLSKSARLQ